MKILDTPRSGKKGTEVAFQSRYGLCLRILVIPKRTVTEARTRAWHAMGCFAQAWSAKLTEAQQQRWIVGAGNVMSANRLGCGPLTGQQLFESINCARACVNLPPFWDGPPAREPFSPNPVGQLTVTSTPEGPRLLVAVTGPVTEDIMVFGQAPCSRGRYRRRNVAYLGLLPPSEDGFTDITDIYTAKYGPLRPNTKIFIVTRQQKNGWEGPDKETSAVVPPEAESPQSTVHSPQSEVSGVVSLKPAGQQASAQPASPSSLYMHTGGTQGVQWKDAIPAPCPQDSTQAITRGAGPPKSVSGTAEMPIPDGGGSGSG